jgi:hypothetical protein
LGLQYNDLCWWDSTTVKDEGNDRLEVAALQNELQQSLVRIFEAASENSDILMRHQNGCMVVEDRCPGDFSDYARLMRDNTLTLTELNAYMKLSFVDKRTGHNWAFLLNTTDFLAIEAELASESVTVSA